MRKKKSKKRTIISISIAGGLLIILIIVGGILRMKTNDLDFFPAVGTFLKETFTLDIHK